MSDAIDLELLERCAKAAYEAVSADMPYSYAWDDDWDQPHESTRQRYYRQARAIIPIVREADAARDAALIKAVEALRQIADNENLFNESRRNVAHQTLEQIREA